MNLTDLPDNIKSIPSGLKCPECGREIYLAIMPLDFQVPIICECLRIKARAKQAEIIKRGQSIIREARRGASGIIRIDHTFDTIIPRKEQETAYHIAKSYCDKFYTKVDKTITIKCDAVTETIPKVVNIICKRGLILSGPTRCGKTTLAEAIGNAIIDNTYIDDYDAEFAGKGAQSNREWSPVRMTSVVDLMAKIKRRYENGDAQELIEMYQSARLTILDDVGAEKPTDWTNERLMEIIDRRCTSELPIIITTNCTPGELQDRLGGRITGRLYEMCAQITINPPKKGMT